MSLTTENILLVGSVLLFISILAGKTSYRFGVPTLVFFLATGMLAGSEGIGGIYFDDPGIAQFIGIVSLNFILFSGGLDTNWKSIRPVLWQGVSLSTLGVFLTAFLVGAFVYFVTDFSLYEGLLLGAIVSSTDAAAVFSVLRSKNLALKYNLRPNLELESGSNDPMAYFLTIAFTGLLIDPGKGIISIIHIFIQQIAIGVLFGFLSGKLSMLVINRIKLGFEGLYPVLVITLMFFTFSATDAVGGNGFLAIYISAVYLGNHDLIHKRAIIKAFDGFAWLMQIVLFLTLGLLVFPSQVVPVFGIGLAISIFLILIARPVSVFISTLFFKVKTRSRLFISWVGLRGAVPIVFATYPLLAGVEKAHMIFNIVFFISLTSVIIQGTTLPVVAKWLRVALPQKTKPWSPEELLLSEGIKSEFIEINLSPDSPAIGKRIVDLNLPKTAIIAMIRRGDKFLVPNGSTTIDADDVLFVISEENESLKKIDMILSSASTSSE